MKIAILSCFYPYRGGISQFNTYLYGELGREHRVKAFNFSRQYPEFLFPGKTQYVTEDDNAVPVESVSLLDTANPFTYISTLKAIREWEPDLVITTFSEEDGRPYTYFYTFKGGKFRELTRRVPYFISVAKIPPYYTPTLVGQGWDSVRLFSPGVRQVVKNGDSYALGSKLNLPKGTTCYNFSYMPPSKNNPEQLIVLTDDERIKLYQGNNHSLIHTTMERFSGSAVGIDHYKGMPGLGVDRNYQMPTKYYAPMELITADIGNTGEPVLLVNKPISTASQFFDRYRYFPQGEIHALYWDGVGLALKWKTRRIRGSVAAVSLADVDNNGVLDLVVGLNTSPDLGVGSRQCMITAYPLDVSAMNPNTPADMSDFEVNPNF